MNNNSIPRAKSPENVGVSSSAVNKMVEELICRGINIHSMMILRYGKVAMEGWSAPLTADMPHMVYSVSKSFLATAYGFALDEGLITRETRVVDIIPELRPRKKDEWLEKLTIHHLLTMTAGKQSSIKGVKNKDWLKDFAKAKWLFEPGNGWRYVNDNYYIAAVMLVRVIGEGVTDYLTPRLFKPLGMDVPFWEKSANGIEAGGWGLMLKTEDMAKFILCYHNGGMYNGVQIIPEWWVNEATSLITDNSDVETHADSSAGYGCGFWRCAGMPNTFRCEGMFCQYAISLRDYDACLIMTSDHSDLQETLDVIWQFLPCVFIEPCDLIGSTKIKLNDAWRAKQTARNTDIETKINKMVYSLRRCGFVNAIGFPVSIFPMPVVFFDYNTCGNMNNVSFEFFSDYCVFSWDEDGGYHNSVNLGLDGVPRDGKVEIGQLKLPVLSYAYWDSDGSLVSHIRALPTVAERILRFRFNGTRIIMEPSSKPGTDEKAQKIGDKLKCILIGKWFHWWIDFLVPKVGKILNPTHYGKSKNQK